MHPGYGFLAENARFAEACLAAGLVFVGPPPAAIRAMGDKIAARRTAMPAGRAGGARARRRRSPTTPRPRAVGARGGLPGDGQGGHGRGRQGDAGGPRPPASWRARSRARASEAGSAFGDATVYIERYVEAPRHIEIQVLADAHGNVVHLGERECSIQRRHQKLVEESPSPAVTPELRQRMGEAACRRPPPSATSTRARWSSCVDRAGAFYFLEMNTRLQVEHPVTELVTGLDLVQEQLRIAAGEKLGFGQDDVTGAAGPSSAGSTPRIPSRASCPSPGRIEDLRAPGGPCVRDDSGI